MNPLALMRTYGEPSVMGGLVFLVATGIGSLIAYDLTHSPSPVARQVELPAVTPPAPAPRQSPVPAPQPTPSPAPQQSPSPDDRSPAAAEQRAIEMRDVTDYTLFQHVEVTIEGRSFTVTTGLTYASTRSTEPESQFCYVEVEHISNHVSRSVNLATKDEDSAVEETPLDASDAKAAGLSLKGLRQSRASCRFI